MMSEIEGVDLTGRRPYYLNFPKPAVTGIIFANCMHGMMHYFGL